MPTSKSSTWGSILQQAVAGVEARLDTILTETNDISRPNNPTSLRKSKVQSATTEQNHPSDSDTATATNSDSLLGSVTFVSHGDHTPNCMPSIDINSTASIIGGEQDTSHHREYITKTETNFQYPRVEFSDACLRECSVTECRLAEGNTQTHHLKDGGLHVPDSASGSRLEAFATCERAKHSPALHLNSNHDNTCKEKERSSELQIVPLKQPLDESLMQGQPLPLELAAQDTKIAPAQHAIQSERSCMNALLQASQSRILVLEEELVTLRSEKKAISASTETIISQLQFELGQTKEMARKVEVDRDLQVECMTEKLEAARIQSEVISSHYTNDSPSAVVRQLETLQSQYSAARKNWESIEASLIAHVSSLENERDLSLRRISELRKKARESASHSKDEIQALQVRLDQALRELQERRETEVHSSSCRRMSQNQLLQSGTVISKNIANDSLRVEETIPLSSQRNTWDDCLSASHINCKDLPQDFFHVSSGISTITNTTSNPIMAGRPHFLDNEQRTLSQIHNSTDLSRISHSPPRNTEMPNSPQSADQEISTGSQYTSLESIEACEATSLDQKNLSFPLNTGQDMISVSNSSAGPSIQLVERMSSAIRRLEAERVSYREELSRVCIQRDEARMTISQLMKDSEAQSLASQRVTELEAEVLDLNSRYQTTLEMLGEKSEMVEELRADIHDIKQMYRELVQRTVG